MNDGSLKRLFTFYVVSVTYCIIQTILAWLFASLLTSAYRNGILPWSPLIASVFQDFVVALLIAVFLFICALFGIAIWSAVSEVRARNRHFRLNYDQHQLDLEMQRQYQHQRETMPPIRQRASAVQQPHTTPLRASRPRRIDRVDTYRREY